MVYCVDSARFFGKFHRFRFPNFCFGVLSVLPLFFRSSTCLSPVVWRKLSRANFGKIFGSKLWNFACPFSSPAQLLASTVLATLACQYTLPVQCRCAFLRLLLFCLPFFFWAGPGGLFSLLLLSQLRSPDLDIYPKEPCSCTLSLSLSSLLGSAPALVLSAFLLSLFLFLFLSLSPSCISQRMNLHCGCMAYRSFRLQWVQRCQKDYHLGNWFVADKRSSSHYCHAEVPECWIFTRCSGAFRSFRLEGFRSKCQS